MDADLLEIVCCPVTHEALSVADADVLMKLNERIASGSVKNSGGHPVMEQISDGLLREDGKILYPIRKGIPVLLPEEGISL